MFGRPLPVRAELSWVVWIMSDNPALAGGVRKLSRTFWVVQSLRSPKLGDICIFVCSYTHIFCDIEMYLYCHRGCFPRPWGYLEAREMRNIKNFMCLQKKSWRKMMSDCVCMGFHDSLKCCTLGPDVRFIKISLDVSRSSTWLCLPGW